MNLFVRKVNKIKEERKKERKKEHTNICLGKGKGKREKKILCVYYIKSE